MRDAPYAFAGATLDRAAELREDAEALKLHFESKQARLLIVRADGRVPVLDDGHLAGLPVDAVDASCDVERASFLGLDGRTPWFALSLPVDTDAALPDGARWVDLRTATTMLPPHEAGLGAYARALVHWQSRKRYCGRCGAATRFDQGGHRARCCDEDCAQQYFPRTDPAIITLVTHGERCLLGRQPSWPEKRYSTLAGFVEPGETLEQAVVREVHEEAGVAVTSMRYVASQPWPFPAALMLGFEAEAADEAIRVGGELADARWFSAAAMRDSIESGELIVSPQLSIAYFLIDRWYRAQTGEALTPGPVWTTR
ncbi:MAG TPA: NAD(+) diphosphatase [Candidatus Saccharimonadia bacterium]|nr:NAD(+) diphosphatase [Candidatus Saccharimonadia bacterium]